MKTKTCLKKIAGLAVLTGLVVMTSCSTDKEQRLEQDIIKTREKIVMLNAELREFEDALQTYRTSEDVYRIPVVVKTLEPATFNHYISVFAEVEAAQEAHISPETNGRIERILVSEGQSVKKGEILIRLNTSVLEASIREAKTSLSLLKTLYERQASLYQQEIGSEVQYLQAKNQYESAQDRLASLEAQLDMAIIKAPFSGVVDNIQVKEGEMASMGMPLMYLVDLSNIIVKASVSERYLSQIKVGDKVDISFPAIDDLIIRTPVRRISSTIDSKTRTFIIEMHVSNTQQRIKPNLIATIQINDYTTDSALVIPAITIKDDFEGKFVFLAEKDSVDRAVKKYIETGLSYQGNTMITSGLNQGDKVIVEGFNMVSSGSLIEILEVSDKQ